MHRHRAFERQSGGELPAAGSSSPFFNSARDVTQNKLKYDCKKLQIWCLFSELFQTWNQPWLWADLLTLGLSSSTFAEIVEKVELVLQHYGTNRWTEGKTAPAPGPLLCTCLCSLPWRYLASGIVAWELLWRLSNPKLLLGSLSVCVLFQGNISWLSRQERQDPLCLYTNCLAELSPQ